MNYKQFLFLLILFLSSCSPSQSPVTEEEKGVSAGSKAGFNVKEIDKGVSQAHMDRVDAFVKWLDVAIEKESWDKITLYAKHVDSLGEMLLSAKIDTKNIPIEFFEIDQKFQESRDFIIEASEKKDVKEIRSEFKRFQETCKQCHAKYREKQ